jgi:hypothetical protein
VDGEAEASVDGQVRLFSKFRALRRTPFPQKDSEASLLRALTQARDLLVRYNHPGQAACVQTLIDAVRLTNCEAYCQLLNFS